METVLAIIAVGVNGYAAYCWIKSTQVEVKSQSDGGYGAMMGGELVVKGLKESHIDFIDSYFQQSRWNSSAAMWTGIGVAVTTLSLLWTKLIAPFVG